ncbi:MAG: hypothetical protein ACJ8AO_15965 [Gemmatimonadaceae bacterium]
MTSPDLDSTDRLARAISRRLRERLPAGYSTTGAMPAAGVPAPVERALHRAPARDAEKRFARPRDFAAALVSVAAA